MDASDAFNALPLPERLHLLSDPPPTFITTTYCGTRRHDHYVYTNFFVEIIHDEERLVDIRAFKDGPKVQELLRILEEKDK